MRTIALGLLACVVSAGCGHTRPTAGASPQHQRERRAVLGEGVLLEATRWDATLVESAAAESEQTDRSGLRERLRARYVDGKTAFTVVLELRDRPGGAQGLDAPDAWWFELRQGGRRVRAAKVELVAIDRFPADSGRAHLRVAMDVAFDGRREGELDLHVGTVRTAGRRAELGRWTASHGALLHWD